MKWGLDSHTLACELRTERPIDKYMGCPATDAGPSPVERCIMDRKVEEKVKIKDKPLGGTEVTHEKEESKEGLLGEKKVEKKVTKEKI